MVFVLGFSIPYLGDTCLIVFAYCYTEYENIILVSHKTFVKSFRCLNQHKKEEALILHVLQILKLKVHLHNNWCELYCSLLCATTFYSLRVEIEGATI